MLQSLDGAAVRRWAATCCDALAAHRDEIDGLNVFPVPDQDTGSNLLATMRAGLDEVLRLDGQDAGCGHGVAALLARGALRGARGNSGIIVSQVLRGFAEALAHAHADARATTGSDSAAGDDGAGGGAIADGAVLRDALHRAERLATAAVAEPVAGTVLTVLQAAALAARETGSDDLAVVASAAATAATRALAETPNQLAVLAKAGVVDAGGLGLVLLLEALVAVVTGRSAPGAGGVAARARPAHTLVATREAGSAAYEYEVMYLLDGTDESRVATLRAELRGLGDCVAAVGSGGGDPVWNVHVHCSDVGAAIEAGIRAGRPHRITVLRFADQVAPAAQPSRFVHDRAVLTMVSGAGVSELLRGEGALVVPTTAGVAELVAALSGSRARHVTLLPAPGTAEVAEAAAAQARDGGQEVVVLPTASPVQALAAIAVHDPGRRAVDDVVAMAEAATATRRGALTVATEEALTWAGRCRSGEVLGMVGDEIVLIDADALTAARRLLDRMLSVGGELVTVLLGADAPDEAEEVLTRHLRTEHPGVEVLFYPGGQPGTVLLLGVE